MEHPPLTSAERCEIIAALNIQRGFVFSPPWLIEQIRRYEATVQDLEKRTQ